jgi:RHS repeat-associated protein
MKNLPVRRVRAIRNLRSEVRQLLRQGLAVVLACAMPGTLVPSDSGLVSHFKQASARHNLPLVVLPSGLDESVSKGSSTEFSRSIASEVLASRTTRGSLPAGASAYPARIRSAVHSPRGLARPALRAAVPSPPPPNPSNTSTISSNFNGTSIAAGNYIWFNSVLKPSGVPSTGATITVSGAMVQFTANNVAYNLPVPDSVITFSSSATTASTVFDAVHNQWQTTVPASYSGNVFLAGISDNLSSSLPGGINPVNWTATFYTDTTGVSLQWQWAAAVYTSFSSNYSALGVKPADALTNSDHAGTPENYKSYVIGGARGGGGSNWTGSYSGTASVTPQVTANHAPVANAGPAQTVFVGTSVQLNGTGSSDPDGLRITYGWSFVSVPAGSTATISDTTNPTPTFYVDKSGSYTAQLIVSDGELNSAPAQVVVTTKNSAPVANAGTDQTAKTGSTVQLDGSGSSDVDGDRLTYRWSIVSAPQGSTATLSDPSIVNPTFVTDMKGTYVIQLIVNDGTIDSAPSQVVISDVNSPPVANAGKDQMVSVGTTVQLDGSHSTDVDGDSLTYTWAILTTPQGSSATLSSTTSVQPTFVADRVGTYVVQLTVNDGTVDSQPKTVTISTNDVAPVANAGPDQTVYAGTQVTLSGSASTDSDGLPLSYQWSLTTMPDGSVATLTSTTTVSTSFTADIPGTYVAHLIVNDGYLNSLPSKVTISTNDVPPVANPGPDQTVPVGATVQLDGTGSTSALNFPLTYKWAILFQPTGGNASLSDPTAAKPTFVPNVAGLYVVQLIVNDGFLDSQPQTMKVTANQTNQPPTVSAGPSQTIELPVNTATLSGSAFSTAPAGSPVAVQWTQVSGAGAVTFADATQAVTQATFPGVGTYTLQLSATVTATGLSNSAQTTVIVVPVNQPPIVTVGPDQTITYPTNTTTLTATTTDDGFPVGSTLQISWQVVFGPGIVTFSNPTQPNTLATFSTPGNYALRLTASDGQYTTSGTLRVAYVAPSAGGISVNAGSDQVIAFPSAAVLSGTASDSNPPAGSTLRVQWSLVSGPSSATATFSAPNALATNVTFSQAGVYVLGLTATDGTFTATSNVKIYAGNVQCTLSNKGTDFWLMFTTAASQVTTVPPGEPPRQLSLFISSDVPTSGTVAVPGQGLNLPFTVTPGQIATVNLPQSVQVLSSDTIETKGIHVTAQNPVAVYGLNFVPFATDGYLGLPTRTLGTSYIIASYRNDVETAGGQALGTEFGITATQDNTNITIVPTASSGNRQATLPYAIQLNQGQTYQLSNHANYTELNAPSGPPVDMTGSVVTSDKPVAVFAGHDCEVIPDNSSFCNSIVEELPPTNLWGQNFVTMPLATERNGDVFRFVAQTDGTHVQVNHQAVAILGRGQFFEQVINGPAEISADNPILVVQYAQSQGASGNNDLDDPSMIIVPPFEQFGGSYTINNPTSGWFPDNFINVIAPTSAAQSGGILLDGTPLAATAFQPIGTSPFSGAQVDVAAGAHTLTGGLPFGVWVYGFKVQDAYGYTGGVCLANGVVGSTVTASPRSSTNPITSQVTIQATVVDASGQPIGGTGVKFAISGVNSQTSYATTDANGLATLSYTSFKTGSDLITISAGSASDTSSITWVSNGPNQPPIVSAGPTQTASLPTTSVFLNGSVVDDGLPIGGTLTSLWTQLSGPASVTFGTPNQPQTQVTFSQAGTYVFQLTGNDSQLSTSATTMLVVYPPNQPPVVNPGPDQTLIFLQNTFLTFSATVTDDGLPAGSTLAVAWSQFSGPDMATFLNGTHSGSSYSTTVSFPSPGTYVLQLNASDGQFTTTKFVNAFVIGPPVVTTPPTTSGLINTAIPVSGTITINGQAPPSNLQFGWYIFSGPSGAIAFFSSPGSLSTQFHTNTAGTYKLCLWAASTQNCGFTTAYVTTTAPTTPTVSISTALDGTQITSPTDITGSVSDGTWTLAYALKDDSHPMTFTTFATGTGAVTNAKLGTLDPTLLLNGTYVLQLSTINAGGITATTSISVSVSRNMKVGVFSLSFNDLTVPVAGIPIQIIRSYDSRDKRVGDFGVGWRLSLANIRVQKSRNLGLNWQETQTQNGFVTQFCLNPTDNKFVTVTFPDGRVFTFQTGTNPSCQSFQNITSATLTFVEQPGPSGTAGATLTAADGGQFVVDGNVPGAVTLVGFDGNTYNPTTFVLKTADGTSYTVDQTLGLTAVTDANGNTLTVSSNGITSSTGKSVPFLRDEQGRITRITDPNGSNLLYTYSAGGDLLGITDRAANPTAYAYDGSHNLTSITTADGKQVLTNTFDTGGRLTATKDGTGFSVTFTHNLPARTETVTDRNGNPTTYVYDSDGNVTQVTDALGHITTSTYDANDNKLSETNALQKTSTYTYDNNGNRLTETDPLQHTTTYTYNALNKPLTITDANQHTTTNTYDGNGNLLTTTDANGKTTTNTYTPGGQLATTKDPLGNVTSFGYDQFGNLATQKDAMGTVTTYASDGNGNRTSQKVTRTLPGGAQQTLTTTYTYDGNGRLTKTTYPDNSTTQTVYNSIGRQVTTIDALNHQTTYQYDNDGRIAQTNYPDNTVELSVYDKNGNRTQFTDRTGVLTQYTYDLLNRLTQSSRGNSPLTINKTSYDAIGQVLTTTDPDNNVTTYAYDDAGRRTTVTDALNHVTTFGYDNAGNQTSVKDANQNVTTYVYDNANRRTQVIYPDGKIDATGYDAVGRVTSRTDANSKVTQYGYDGIGRLTSVVQDAVSGGLNLLTQYTYDEVGDRMKQIDANNHATSYAYDQRGRRTQRALPLGQSESYTYDANGNLLTRTDFNGKTTTYTYDAVNHLLSKTPDPSFHAPAVTYSYVRTQRISMIDSTGTSNWSYDSNGHVTQITRPVFGTSFYTYDAAGNLKTLQLASSPIIIVNYTYDALNRMKTVQETNTGTTSYTYDNVGNLQSVTYPNGVVHGYSYDTRNRLTNLGVTKSSSNLFGYNYTLDAAGHRTQVTELSGRTVNYGYDSIYRLTSETIAGDPNNVNGAASYVYDAVGNRTQKTSTIPGFPGGLTNYNANDQLSTDTYDNDGNTTASNGLGYVYDFENHVIQAGAGITMVYDGDGNRVSKTVAGVTTKYLVDPQSPTGYAQVVYETFSGSSSPSHETSRIFVYGLERISQFRSYILNSASHTQTSYYVYDGHGSTRALTDPNGNVTDTYDYDAFGNLLHSTATGIPPGGTTVTATPNEFLFAGEQFDSDLNLYYNRARYLNTSTGRFMNMDQYEGDSGSPASLHKYVYAGADPVNRFDPAGNDFDLATQVAAVTIVTVLANLTITGLAIVAPNGKGGGSASPTGLFVSLRVGLAYYGLYAGGGVDFYYDIAGGRLYYAPTAEFGTTPLSLFKNFSGGQYSFSVGGAWVSSPGDLEGKSFSAVWPGRFFFTALGTLAGNEAFGTLTAIARSTKNISFKNWSAIFGYSPSGGSYFQVAFRSNNFASTFGYSGDYRPFSDDVQRSLGWVADKIRAAASSLNVNTYLQLLQDLEGY